MMRTFALALCFLLFHSIVTADALALARGPAVPPTRQAMLVATAIARLGPGEGSLLAARLHDKTVVKGWLTGIERDSFVVTDNEFGIDQRVAYAQVARLQGVNLVSGRQVQVGGGLKARVARVAALLLPVHRVQSNSLTSGESRC